MKTTPYRFGYVSKRTLDTPWYMHLNLKTSVCIMTTLHFILLYMFCNGVPLFLWNIVWEIGGLRALPL